MLGSLAAMELPESLRPPVRLPAADADPHATYPPDPLRDALSDEDRIEVPVFTWPHTPADTAPPRRLLRISAQLYNEPADYDRLASALAARLPI
jgi:isopenicillin-N epimerase